MYDFVVLNSMLALISCNTNNCKFHVVFLKLIDIEVPPNGENKPIWKQTATFNKWSIDDAPS